jgi:hypothetical protein
MGRKKKALHLRRHPQTISLPLDILKHLHEITEKGLTVSRYIEILIRKEIQGLQTSLSRHVWWCPECDETFHVQKKSAIFKHKCGKWLDNKVHYRGTLEEYNKGGEEE